ncbi:MAG: FKBP-type peptidyl-prolyl cis-trans isomerase [Pseudomonadota bacterium]
MIRRVLKSSLSVLSVATLLAACSKDAETDAAAPVETQEEAAVSVPAEDEAANAAAVEAAKAKRKEEATANLAASRAFLEENAGREGVKTTDSGLQYQILSEGEEGGRTPAVNDLVDVHYVGTFIDGVEFDSSRARGAAARFLAGQVIDGWVEALQLMSEGDRYRLFIPPNLAYGEAGAPGAIGPNQALIFDVELLGVTNPQINMAAAKSFLTDNAGKDGVVATNSGLQYKVLNEGAADGASPTDANVVRVHYEGRLLNGTVFDSSYERGAPAEFPLSQVIPGWIEGVQLMSVGDKFQFYIQPELAYGVQGRPPTIGPNELLVFDVELLEVKE